MGWLCCSLSPRLAREGEILNIGKLRKGGELYYLNSIARGVEDYYTGSGEAPGYWIASGAAGLGLLGEVGESQLKSVLNGRDPLSGARLINTRSTNSERVPGFDLTFRAPKSVSLLHALGDSEASNEVFSAHDAAVAAALGYLEREAAGARRGKGGLTRIGSKGFIGAAFRHRSSRAGDPLLHTHVLVANVIQGDDGRWGALDGRQLYLHAKTAGYLYQAHLRAELTRRLGVEWSPVRSGCADLAGISPEVIRAFSKRRAEVQALLGESGSTNGKAAQTAALMSRKAKDYAVTPARLLPEWKERAARLGLDDQSLEALLHRIEPSPLRTADIEAIERELTGPDGLTAQASSFTRRDAIQGMCSRLSEGASVERVEELTEKLLDTDEVVMLPDPSPDLTMRNGLRMTEGSLIPAGVHERRFSTIEMLAVERSVIEAAVQRRQAGCAVAATEQLDAALARRPSLFPDQKDMVRTLTRSGQGVDVVVGKAGAGKTFALDAAREAWQASGYKVLGCSLSARAAEQLQSGSGIQSFTVAALLKDLEHPTAGGLTPQTVVVVDEAAMVGTRQLDRLLTKAAEAQAKVVLVGDDHQLPEIDSGGAFRGIKNRLPAVELLQVRRQPLGWERNALQLLREGHALEAVDTYIGHDRVVLSTSSEETRSTLIADWWAAQAEGEPPLILASRRSDVADLNARARFLMRAAGLLGETEVQIGEMPFSTGDRVMTLKNTRRLGVKNGTKGRVSGVDPERGEVTISTDEGAVLTLPNSYLEAGHLTHAYAMTGHKAQGMTAARAYVLGDQTLYREWAYVAMSRGRDENRLYVVTGTDLERDDVGGEVAGVDDPLQELVAAVGRSRAKELALETYREEDRNPPSAPVDMPAEHFMERTIGL